MLWESIPPSFRKVLCYFSVIISFIADGLWFGGWSFKGWHNSQKSKNEEKNQRLSAFSAPVPQDMATQDFALIPREYFRFLENFLKLRT